MSARYNRDLLLPPSEEARNDTDPQHESPSLIHDKVSPSSAIEDNNAPTPASNGDMAEPVTVEDSINL